MALRDFLKAPVVKKINTGMYNGTPGSTIIIHAKDDFRVVEVKLSIYLASTGELLEEGNATLANTVGRVLNSLRDKYPSLLVRNCSEPFAV